MPSRQDYRTQDFISYDEAADLCGLSRSRIKTLAATVRKGRRLFARGNAVGPYRIDRKSFEEFIRTGAPCGPQLPSSTLDRPPAAG